MPVTGLVQTNFLFHPSEVKEAALPYSDSGVAPAVSTLWIPEQNLGSFHNDQILIGDPFYDNVVSIVAKFVDATVQNRRTNPR